MSDVRGMTRSSSWFELFPLSTLLASLRLAVNLRALVFAALALAATSAGWRLCGLAFTALDEEGARGGAYSVFSTWPWQKPEVRGAKPGDLFQEAPITPSLPIWSPESPRPGLPAATTRLGTIGEWIVKSPIVYSWDYLTKPLRLALTEHPNFAQMMYYILCALWALAIWAVFGGAISRFAAVALAREEQPSWGQLTGYARRKWLSYFSAPLFPMFGVLLLAIPMALVGFLLHYETSAILAGILWPLVLIAAAVMAILVIGLFFGWPLMWSTISAEGTDAFDALSRSYSYTFQRPLHYLFYSLLACFLGTLGWILVALFQDAIIRLSRWATTLGSTTDRFYKVLTGEAGQASDFGASLIHFWEICVGMLALGFAFSYFWTAMTAIYFLLRRHVDATELDEVYLPEEQELFGLPPLKSDAAGVPIVADVPGSAPTGNGGAT